jgi:hypothetical protein
MARALDQILQELHAVYNPQKDQYNQALSQVDPQQQAEEQGLQAAKTDAFAQIDQGANRRGLFYSGMPIAEEQKYVGQNFLPSLANLRSKYAQQKFDLTNALNKVTSDEYSQAYGIHQNEVDSEEKQREFDRQLAAQQAAAKSSASSSFASPTLGTLGMGNAGAQGSYTQKSGGGFAFSDGNGRPVSAATYSQITGIPFRSLLQQMAAAGDNGAKSALSFVGNDYGYDPSKVYASATAIPQNTSLYNNLIWGATNPKTGKALSQAKYSPI